MNSQVTNKNSFHVYQKKKKPKKQYNSCVTTITQKRKKGTPKHCLHFTNHNLNLVYTT